jgi:hypothetical protein
MVLPLSIAFATVGYADGVKYLSILARPGFAGEKRAWERALIVRADTRVGLFLVADQAAAVFSLGPRCVGGVGEREAGPGIQNLHLNAKWGRGWQFRIMPLK